MLRALAVIAVLCVAACHHDAPPPAPAHDPDAPVAAPVAPVQQEPLKPR